MMLHGLRGSAAELDMRDVLLRLRAPGFEHHLAVFRDRIARYRIIADVERMHLSYSTQPPHGTDGAKAKPPERCVPAWSGPAVPEQTWGIATEPAGRDLSFVGGLLAGAPGMALIAGVRQGSLY